MAEQQFPEPVASALIFNKEGKVLLAKSHKWSDSWVIMGGHIELGETILEALKREIKEETNLDIYDEKLIMHHEFIFDNIFHKKKHFIMFNFTAKTDSEDVKLNDEAEEFKWVTLDEALEMKMDPYTRKLIEKIKD